jgi:hypothetical protein
MKKRKRRKRKKEKKQRQKRKGKKKIIYMSVFKIQKGIDCGGN